MTDPFEHLLAQTEVSDKQAKPASKGWNKPIPGSARRWAEAITTPGTNGKPQKAVVPVSAELKGDLLLAVRAAVAESHPDLSVTGRDVLDAEGAFKALSLTAGERRGRKSA